MEYRNKTYLDLGFNSFGLRRVQSQAPISANMADYLLELSESSIGTKIIKDLAVKDGKIESLSADKITAGTFSAVNNVGSTSVKIDGENKRIIINDGTKDRVLMGFLQNGF